MDLSNAKVVIRPRSAWESIDLGIAMANHWFFPIIKAWVIVTLPIFVLLQFFLPYRDWLPITLFWWFKPLWERIPLYILSRSLFGETPTTKDTLKAYPSMLSQNFFSFLLFTRINTRRSFLLPVRVLENIKGKKRRMREKTLTQEDVEPATWLTFIGVHIEFFLLIGLFALIYLFTPEYYQSSLGESLQALETKDNFFNSAWLVYACMSLVAPYYVASGFSLYLNRRIKLEGWDLEVTFREMARENQKRKSHPVASVFALLVFATTSLYSNTDLRAAEPESKQTVIAETESSREQITEILASDDFHERITQHSPVLDIEDETIQKLINWLEGFFNDSSSPDFSLLGNIAAILEFIFWTILLILIVALLYYYRHWLKVFLKNEKQGNKNSHTSSTGFSEKEEHDELNILSGDIVNQSRVLWEQGESKEALLLLYKGALQVFTSKQKGSIPHSATERECLRIINSHVKKNEFNYFSELSRAWVFSAYGYINPSDEHFIQLCTDWSSRWQQPLEAPPEDSLVGNQHE